MGRRLTAAEMEAEGFGDAAAHATPSQPRRLTADEMRNEGFDYTPESSVKLGDALPTKNMSVSPEAPADPGVLSTIAHEGLNGFFKGGSDELGGAVNAGLRSKDVGSVGLRQKDGSVKMLNSGWDMYRAGRDTEREKLAGAAEHHPKLSFLANVAGDIGSDAALSMLGVPVGNQVYQTAVGAINGLLSDNSELTPDKVKAEDIGNAGTSALLNGVASYAIPKAGRAVTNKFSGSAIEKYLSEATKPAREGISKALESAGKKLDDWSAMKAIRALGPNVSEARGLDRRDRMLEVGKLARDSGIITPMAGLGTIAERASKAADESGQAVGGVLGKLDELSTPAQRVRPSELASKIEGQVIGPIRRQPIFDNVADSIASEAKGLRRLGHIDAGPTKDLFGSKLPEIVAGPQREFGAAGEKPTLKRLQAMAKALAQEHSVDPAEMAAKLEKMALEMGPSHTPAAEAMAGEAARLREAAKQGIPFKEANALKGSYDDFLNFDKEQTPAKEFLKQTRGVINSEIESKARDVSAPLADELGAAKRKYGNVESIRQIAERELADRKGRRLLGLTDNGMGYTGALAGVAQSMMHGGDPIESAVKGAAGYIGGSLAHKIAREHGNQLAMGAGDQLSKLMLNGLPAMVQKAPQLFGKYGPALVRAFGRSPLGAVALDRALTKNDPEYAALRQNAAKQLSLDEANP